LHLASAEEIKADYFCTCDDNFLKKAKKIEDLEIRVISLLEIVRERKMNIATRPLNDIAKEAIMVFNY
jgi:hypothetical protein